MSEIQSALSQLSEHERGTLAALLLDSLPPHSNEDAAPEGIDEAVRRREELNTGKARALNAEEFWAAIDRERATWK